MHSLYSFLMELDKRKIHYNLHRIRHESIMVDVAVPGQRWEIELMQDGTIEIEKFISDGHIFDEKEIAELYKQFSD